MSGNLELSIETKKVYLYGSAVGSVPIIYLNTYSGTGREVYLATKKLTNKPFFLAVIGNIDWDRDMSPWDCPAISKDDTPCTGGGSEYLRLLVERIIRETEKHCSLVPAWRGLAGYSLAGLFSLYSMYETSIFSRIASVSGSLWFPRFLDFVKNTTLPFTPDCVYLSLGSTEHETKNPYLSTVKERTEEVYEHLKMLGLEATFEINEGGHFTNPALRTARAISFLLEK